MKKTLKRLCTGFLALATVVTALPTTPVHAESKQYWIDRYGDDRRGERGHPGGIADSDSRSLVRHIDTNRSNHGHLQCDYKQNG